MKRDILTLADLTPEDRAAVLNGCGGKGGFIRPPQFHFEEDCNDHDLHYWRGGNRRDRLRADWRFLLKMLRDVSKVDMHHGVFAATRHFFAAILYFLAVRWFGSKFFYFGTPRTVADLPSRKHATKAQAAVPAPQAPLSPLGTGGAVLPLE